MVWLRCYGPGARSVRAGVPAGAAGSPRDPRPAGREIALNSSGPVRLCGSENCTDFGARITGAAWPPSLTAGLRRGAVDLRVDAQVIERAGEDRHSGRRGPAARTDIPVIIAALPRGERTDNQPDGKKQRPDVHGRKPTQAPRCPVRYGPAPALFQKSGSWRIRSGSPGSSESREGSG